MKKLLGAAASAAVLCTGAQAFAATLVIDDFSAEQRVQDTPGFEGNVSQIAGGGILGGYRDLSVKNTAADGDNRAATELHVTGGNIKFSNVAGARGEGTLTYDGDDDPSSVNTTGLGGVNLLIGTDPYFYFASPPGVPFDNVAEVRIQVWDIFGKTGIYTETIDPDYDPKLAFSDAAFAGIDFSKIGALQFFISSTSTNDSVDGAITGIEVRADDVAPVPLPASGLLLLGGMGGLTFLRRRKKA
ncbi:VPLPA-CTERM sorting domain-containing protein [Paracoccus shandongensis]|uniref:VPLPA-CTERM sorting domain-containing protein n=1 Tax=Paracoccus shandongensis TaxID=2816048 RepID=UPI001A90C20D|nr:VPLPA-CTERM sorting domain-containing protein [Paracoccus shandongensis]